MLHHNYCIIKKFIYQIGNPEVKTDRNIQDCVSDVENCCIIKKFIHQIGNLKVRNRQE